PPQRRRHDRLQRRSFIRLAARREVAIMDKHLARHMDLWSSGIASEIDFCDDRLTRYPQERTARLNSDNQLEPLIAHALRWAPHQQGQPYRVLDVGSGPLNRWPRPMRPYAGATGYGSPCRSLLRCSRNYRPSSRRTCSMSSIAETPSITPSIPCRGFSR